MNTQLNLSIFLPLTLLLAAPLPAGDMVVFGDSLSDGGYYLGIRFTDGDLWHETLADRLDHQRATVGGFLGSSGLNFAVGGALVSNLSSQVTRYQSRHTWQSGDLCALWIGGNDLRDNSAQNMPALATQIGGIITRLTGLGIDHFIVPNLPDLGAIPESLGNPALIAARRAGTIAFNAALADELDSRATALGVTIDRLDVFGMFEKMLANSADYGLTNTTGEWRNTPPDTPSEQYAFWDDIHPTSRSHFLLAAAAQVVLDPEGAGIEMISWSISPAGTLRQTWLAHPGLSYQILSGLRPDALTPAASFLGSPAYTATIAGPGTPTGFFQTQRD